MNFFSNFNPFKNGDDRPRLSAGAQRQALRDAAKDAAKVGRLLAKEAAAKGAGPAAPLQRTTTNPAYMREQARRDLDMMSSSFRRRMTWQQSLCVAPIINLAPIPAGRRSPLFDSLPK